MPNSNTFSIKPIKELIEKYIEQTEIPFEEMIIIDPFANTNTYGTITNDLNPTMPTDYHLEATDFLKQIDDYGADMVLYDPSYSPRQVSEVYKKFDLSVNIETTQASYWSKQKEQISRITRPGGIVISFGWNSGGVGKKYGFEIIEVLLVPHGGWHNDTICTVERKTHDSRRLLPGRRTQEAF